MKYVWAMDISLKNTGVAIFDAESEIPVLWFDIPTDSKLETKDRLKILGSTILSYLEKYPCKTLVVENSFTRFNKATQQLYRAHGVVNYVFADCKEQIYYSPRSIKKLISGDGKADKQKVKEYINKRYPDVIFSSDDISDAFGIGLVYFNLNKESI